VKAVRERNGAAQQRFLSEDALNKSSSTLHHIYHGCYYIRDGVYVGELPCVPARARWLTLFAACCSVMTLIRWRASSFLGTSRDPSSPSRRPGTQVLLSDLRSVSRQNNAVENCQFYAEWRKVLNSLYIEIEHLLAAKQWISKRYFYESTFFNYCYLHMRTGKVWIYRLFVCLFVCLFVRLRISPPRIKLAASNFAGRFIGVQGRKSPVFGELCSPRSPKSDESASAPSL